MHNHNNNIQDYPFDYQVIDDGKYVVIGLRKIRVPQPIKKGRKWRIEICYGKHEGKRVRKIYYFDSEKEAKKQAVKLILDRELNKVNIIQKILEDMKKGKIRIKGDPTVETVKYEPPRLKLPKITKRGKKWSFTVRIENKKRRFSFDTYEEAYNAAYEYAKRKEGEKGELTFTEALELYRRYYATKKNHDIDKIKDHFRRFYHFLRKWGNVKISQINEQMIHNYIYERLNERDPQTGEKIKGSTINRELAHLRVYFDFLITNGYMKGPNLAHKVLKEKRFEENKRERYLSIDEIIRFFEALKKIPDDPFNRQRKGVLLVLFFTGARVREVFRLERKHLKMINVDGKKYWILHFQANITKRGIDRKIDIPEAVAYYLLNMPKKPVVRKDYKESEDYLFPDFKTQYMQRKFAEWFYQEFLKEANIENFFLHDFRHNWTSYMLDAGAKLMTVKELGGWGSLSGMEPYTHRIGKNENIFKNFLEELIIRRKLEREKLKELEGSKPEENKGEEK